MTDNSRLRSTISKLVSRLSEDERKRLHFNLGNDVPRHIQDDHSLRGTLNLMETLFHQEKINDHDCTFLIDEFQKIQYQKGVQILEKYMKEKNTEQFNDLNEEDKKSFHTPFLMRQTAFENNIEMNILSKEKETIPQSSKSPKNSSRRLNCIFGILLTFFLVGLCILTYLNIHNTYRFIAEIDIKDRKIRVLTENNSEVCNERFYQLQNQSQLRINALEKFRLTDNQTIANLTAQLVQLFKERIENENTIEEQRQLQSQDQSTIRSLNQNIDRIRQTCSENSPVTMKSIKSTNIPPWCTGCGCPCTDQCQKNCIEKFSATDGRCEGVLDMDCECLIEGVWHPKEGQCPYHD